MPKGGARPGSGPKPKPAEDKKDHRTFSLPYDVIDFLKTKPNASQYVAALIKADMLKKGSD